MDVGSPKVIARFTSRTDVCMTAVRKERSTIARMIRLAAVLASVTRLLGSAVPVMAQAPTWPSSAAEVSSRPAIPDTAYRTAPVLGTAEPGVRLGPPRVGPLTSGPKQETGPNVHTPQPPGPFLPSRYTARSDGICLSPAAISNPEELPPPVSRPIARANRQADPLSAEQLTAALPELSRRAVHEQVARHVASGSRLAGRGAYYSARREFETAVQLVAEALDQAEGTTRHRRALADAWTAWEEAEDFARLAAESREESAEQLSQLIATHRTEVLHGSGKQLTVTAALQAYFQYAQQRLGEAVGREPAVAEALYGLGRVYAMLAAGGNTHERLAIPKALSLYRTAVSIVPTHANAANELAVLLARYGRWQEAKQVLQAVPMERRSAEMWHNLAVIHETLGERQWAAEARQHQWAAAERQARFLPRAVQDGNVQWFDVTAWVDQVDGPSPVHTAGNVSTNGAARR
ncbi:MAG: hypothetical protein KatS3mg110_0107 [Pirellulaceae bacterium]|nr:MAG: hypothetical protein KatS3mg110_0107 [Pirellulaceae bacterium]